MTRPINHDQVIKTQIETGNTSNLENILKLARMKRDGVSFDHLNIAAENRMKYGKQTYRMRDFQV